MSSGYRGGGGRRADSRSRSPRRSNTHRGGGHRDDRRHSEDDRRRAHQDERDERPSSSTTVSLRPNPNAVLNQSIPKQVVLERKNAQNFYVRYYIGHRGKFGHEFLEFEFRNNGRLRYANNSNYKRDTMIRKEAYVSPQTLHVLMTMIRGSEILDADDELWPEPDTVGRQELEIVSCSSFRLPLLVLCCSRDDQSVRNALS